MLKHTAVPVHISIRPRQSMSSNASIPSFTVPTTIKGNHDTPLLAPDTPLTPSGSPLTVIDADCGPQLSDSLSEKIEKYNKTHFDRVLPFATLNSVSNPINDYVDWTPICNTLQGRLYRATATKIGCDAIIKKTEKRLYQKRITEQKGTSIIVEENILKEAIILHHLTVDNKSIYSHIVRFIQFFETDNAFYLVMENAGNMNLAQFIQKAHQFIAKKKMKIKYWRKIVKYIFWQLAVIIHWLHDDMRCCHLDLNAENVMILNGNFIQDKNNNTITVDANIKIKLVDFGLSEIFRMKSQTQNEAKHNHNDEYTNNDFKCAKHGITDKCNLSAPRVFGDQVYDACKADIWALGILLYQLSTGLEPYKLPHKVDPAFCKIETGKFLDLIVSHNKMKHFNVKMMNLLSDLLNTNESERIDSSQLLRNEWLCLYYDKYKSQIRKKSKLQLSRNKTLKQKMEMFPYYK